MIKRRPKKPHEGKAKAELPITEAQAVVAAALAKRRGVSIQTLWYELLANGYREFGQRIPLEVVRYLKEHNRPIPPPLRRDPKKHGLH
jgi:hypothetical protein